MERSRFYLITGLIAFVLSNTSHTDLAIIFWLAFGVTHMVMSAIASYQELQESKRRLAELQELMEKMEKQRKKFEREIAKMEKEEKNEKRKTK